MTSIIEIATKVASALNIDPEPLIEIIKTKIDPSEFILPETATTLFQNIDKLIENNNEINTFESRLKTDRTKQNYNILKKSMGKLQILTLINRLNKSTNCDEILNSFIVALNDNVSSVNNILSNKMKTDETIPELKGGGINEYYEKYLKYKKKYLNIKYM